LSFQTSPLGVWNDKITSQKGMWDGDEIIIMPLAEMTKGMMRFMMTAVWELF
jgi:hypothetical protein